MRHRWGDAARFPLKTERVCARCGLVRALRPRARDAPRRGAGAHSVGGILEGRGEGGAFAGLRGGEMSVQGMNWAYGQMTGSPAVQIVLLLLAHWSDDFGNLRMLQATYLAKRSQQSERSIYRHLAELERRGMLTREANGHKRDGTPLISGKLHFDRHWIDEGGDCQMDGEGTANLAVPPGGTDTGDSRAVPIVSVHNNEQKNLERESTTTDTDTSVRERRGEHDFAEFRSAYPFDATMDREAAKSVFEALPKRDRDTAVRMAAVYSEALRRRGKTQPLSAARWLRERKFDEVRELSTPVGKSVFVVEGTRAFELWNARQLRLKNQKYPSKEYSGDDPQFRGKSGWFFPSLIPPDDDKPP